MVIRYPNYYKKFQCIAGTCPDTCCAGWEIAVDPASEKRYQSAYRQLKKTKPDFARKLKTYIKDGGIISEDVTCPFLDQNGLCEMYIELGPESLCHTCKRHPRHMEDYGNLHEMMLLMSCPEAARLILEENDGGFYTRNLPERHGNMDGIDENLLEILLEARELIFDVLERQGSSLNAKMAFALALGHDIQRRIAQDAYTYADVRAVLKRYGKENALDGFLSQWKGRGDIGELMNDLTTEFENLDTICRGWPKMVEYSKNTLRDLRSVSETYGHRWSEFAETNPAQEAGWTNVLRYFLYSFMLTALYDGDVLTKIKMAVLCTMLIMELDLADWLNGKCPDRVAHGYSLARQVENSDENRRKLEQIFKQEKFSSRRIIDVLLSKTIRMEL